MINQQGDVLALRDASNNVVASYSYNAWGEIISSSGSMANTNPLRYRGYYYDTETGFYYLQSRYYDPVICRFINADGYVSTGQDFLGFNMFAYCLNNPVNGTDPTGCFRTYSVMEADTGGGGGAVIIGTGLLLAKAIVSLVDTISKSISQTLDEVKNKEQSRNHSVYVLRDYDGYVQYVGRTLNPEAREQAHHANPDRRDLKMEIIAEGLSLQEARALEQAGMVFYHTINSANKMNNQINGIAPKYWPIYQPIAQGIFEFGWNLMTNEILYWLGL